MANRRKSIYAKRDQQLATKGSKIRNFIAKSARGQKTRLRAGGNNTRQVNNLLKQGIQGAKGRYRILGVT